MIETAKSLSGRVVVVVPHGVLFRGASEGKIRQKLIEENLLDAVIGLPTNLFTSTGIPVAILVFDRSREQNGKNQNRKDIVFIDASKEFRTGKAQNFLEDAHIEKIVSTYRERKSVDKYSYVATPDEICDNSYNLNIPRYVDTFEEEEEIDVKALQCEIEKNESELAEIRQKMDRYLKELGGMKK
jgi:type I restriction enzyme M protein